MQDGVVVATEDSCNRALRLRRMARRGLRAAGRLCQAVHGEGGHAQGRGGEAG